MTAAARNEARPPLLDDAEIDRCAAGIGIGGRKDRIFPVFDERTQRSGLVSF